MKIDKQAWLFAGMLLIAVCILLWPFFAGMTVMPSDSLKSLPLSRFGEQEFFSGFRFPQWIPMMFGGMPCYGSVMVTPSYLVSDVFSWGLGRVFTVFKDPLAQHVVHLLLLGGGSFLYLRRMNVSRVSSIIVSLNLMLMPGLTGLIGAGHTIKLWTICWMPLLLWLLEGILRRGRARDIGLGALALGMMLSAKHIQLSWYFLILAGVYTLVRVIQLRVEDQRHWLPPLARAAGFVALGLLLASFLYLPVLEYSELSLRGGAESSIKDGTYAAAYSYPPGDLASWWIPSIKGFGGQDYWGLLEYTAFPLYMGALWLVPLLLIAFQRPGLRQLAWLLPAFVLFLLGIGEHGFLFGLFVDHLPFYAKFRAHMWALAPAQMLILFASGDGWDRLLVQTPKAATQRVDTIGRRWLKDWPLLAGAAMFLFALLAISIAPATPQAMSGSDGWKGAQDEARMEYAFARQGLQPAPAQLQAELLRLRHGRAVMGYSSLARTLALAGAGLILAGLYRRQYLKGEAVVLALGALVVLDCVPIARTVMTFDKAIPVESHFRPHGVMGVLSQAPDKHTFRIWPKDGYPYNEAVWHGLHSIDGYHGAKLGVVQQMFDAGRINTSAPGGTSLHPVLLDLLNVRYVISYHPIDGLVPLGQAEDGILLENQDALPRVSFPSEFRELDGSKQLAALLEPGFNPRKTVLLENPPVGLDSGPLVQGQATVKSYEPERITYSISNSGPAVALLSEIWVPKGWQAWLDGDRVPILRADHLLRAIPLPTPGQHELTLEYTAPGWKVGLWGSALGLLLALVLVFLPSRQTGAPSPTTKDQPQS